MQDKETVLEVRHLSVRFTMYTHGVAQHDLEVIPDLSVSVRQGEILAVVGSSGSGKSILADAIMGILPDNCHTEGELFFKGRPLDAALQEKLRGREMALIPQSVSYLDPLMRIDRQGIGTLSDKEHQQEIFRQFRLDERTEQMYPHQLSGGMARRVLAATAVISDATLVIADEPTPGLSESLAKEMLKTFRDLADRGKAVMLITHDIDLALDVADRIAVFYAGTTLETAPAADFSGEGERLRHPYTKAFYLALPQTKFQPIPGLQPYAGNLPEGCVFSPRCDRCTDECKQARPDMRALRDGFVRCFHAV